ncbi:MAG: DUF362 domain-containing protein [Succiniclasticum sp.]|nr:DUF362 domain-containing protein [Succiniclasticum sp.]
MRTKAKVYFADFHMPYGGDPLPVKLRKLMKKAGFEELDLKDKFVAIKMHFGEKGNLAFLRPNYAKAVADYVKERGGKPFLTDCNTLYVGSRKNALEHLDTAYENGFNPLCTGCQTIIADGLKGTDEELLPVPNGEFVREAKVGKALADADVVLSLTHFKGHEMAGFGGAIKNVGMGGGSRAGKMEQHSDGKVQVDQAKCVGCGRCVNICAHGAPSLTDRKSSINPGKCVGCGRCLALCPTDAIAPIEWQAASVFNKKMAEYAAAIVHGKPQFHISLIVDVSPNCDCHAENDVPIVPDIGMLCSTDMVALDQACADLVNAAEPLPNGQLARNIAKDPEGAKGQDYFHLTTPESDWKTCLAHAEKIGLGTREYDLIR